MKRQRTIVYGALFIFFSLGFYFFIIHALGWADKTYLRAFNGLIVLLSLNYTIKMNMRNGRDNYPQNMMSSVAAGVIGVLLSVIGLAAFLTFKSDTIFISEVANNLLFANGEGINAICFGILFEGIASVVIFSFILMQYWKGVNVKLFSKRDKLPSS